MGKIKKFTKDHSIDYYRGIKGIYFYGVLKKIIAIRNLRKRKVKILDFGCGLNKLKSLLPDKVTGYDIQPRFTEIDHWRNVKFDILVSNQVFYLMTKKELREFLDELHEVNPKVELIVSITRRTFLQNIFKHILGEGDAWADTQLLPSEELRILCEKMEIVNKTDYFKLVDIYVMKFKEKAKKNISKEKNAKT